jgi:hypothetical protein
MPFEMEIEIEEDGKHVWRRIAMVTQPPYRYETREEAERMLRICYGELLLQERLGERQRARVVEV